ncbi:uroporphyrinogen-III C-methyltransferase [Thalassiella azotivora]
MTTLLGLDLAGRAVLVAGGGPVAARRARGLLEDGAVVRVVAPTPGAELRGLLADPPATGALTWAARPVRADDLDGTWLAVTATGDPAVDAKVRRWADARRVFCVAGRDGSARCAAVARSGDLLVGVVSAGAPDPRRSTAVRDAVADLLDHGRLPVRRRRPGPGRVVLVGGGPGAPDLLTVRARRALAEADVVVTDRLAPTEVLADLPPEVEVVDVGKAPGRHPLPQRDIERLLVARARRGQVVVRLKGGDPFVLGRGGEEVRACRDAGVPVEVVPGVTSAVAVPAAAGIPVTHRGAARGFAVLTGHDGLDGALAATLVRAGATVVVLMGAAALDRIALALRAHDVRDDVPVAVVERGCTPRQHLRRTTVGGLPGLGPVRAPAVVVVGDVAAAGLLAEHVRDPDAPTAASSAPAVRAPAAPAAPAAPVVLGRDRPARRGAARAPHPAGVRMGG